MLVAIEDVSGQIGHNNMRDKYVETPQNRLTGSIQNGFEMKLQLLSSPALKVEPL